MSNYKRMALAFAGLKEADDDKKKKKSSTGDSTTAGGGSGLAHDNQIAPKDAGSEKPERDRPTSTTAAPGGPSMANQPPPGALSPGLAAGGEESPAAGGEEDGQQPSKPKKQSPEEKEKKEKEIDRDIEKIDEPEKVKPKTKLGKFIVKNLNEATHMNPRLSSGGNIHTPVDRTSTEFSDKNLSQDEVRIIDKNAKKILAFAKKAFDSKPYGLAMRLIERYLERIGIPNAHSGDVADVIASAFNKDTDPKSSIYYKVRPKVLPKWNPLSNVTPDYLQGM